jgi:hypothetical protein
MRQDPKVYRPPNNWNGKMAKEGIYGFLARVTDDVPRDNLCRVCPYAGLGRSYFCRLDVEFDVCPMLLKLKQLVRRGRM